MFDLSKTGVKEPVLISGLMESGPSSCWLSSTTSTIPLGQMCSHVFNDIIAAGADLFTSLDYVATGKNEPAKNKWLLVWQKAVQAGAAHRWRNG